MGRKSLHSLRGHPRAILITVCTASFMTSLDMSVVNIAMPVMAKDLGASLAAVAWVVDAYLMAIAVLVITCGRLGDLYGHRRLFMCGAALFTLSSAACGLSPGVQMLIVSRAVQGIGAALMYPQSMAIIVSTFPSERRGAALGILNAVSGVASITGPLIGGLVTSLIGWRGVLH